MLHFTTQQLTAEAARLGLSDGEPLTQQARSGAAASLAAAAATNPDEPAGPTGADADAVLTVYADGPVLLNGAPFPLHVAREPVEIITRPEGETTVRLTFIVGAVHLLPGKLATSTPPQGAPSA